MERQGHGLVSMQGSTILNKTVEVGKTIVGGVPEIYLVI